MDVSNLIQQHRNICILISEKRIKQGLEILSDMISRASSGYLRDEYDTIVMTYMNMLTYTIDGISDPERNKIYTKLIQSILKLSDKVRQDILSHTSGWHTYWIKQQAEKEMRLTGKNIVESVDDLVFKSELDEWLSLNEIIPKPDSGFAKRHRRLIRNIFNHLWLTDYYGEAENSLIDIILKSGKFRWHEVSIFTTALTLSALRTWQTEKILHLIRIYENGHDKIMERALSGLILNLYYYDGRIRLYPELIEKIELMSLDEIFREHCRIIILQIIRSRETEKLGRRLHDELLPKVEKLKPLLEEKLDLENILPHFQNEEKNPDWSKMFNESDQIFKTMEELTRLQLEGADVYMTAFANMKHFDFFKDFQNWFMPFYPEHETIDEIYRDEILGPGTNELAEALYKTPFICNSDKYSLLLNLKYLPAAQKTMMLKVFRMELDGLQELNADEVAADPFRTFRINVTQYIQDIYRFFKLSPYRKEFEDIFNGKLDIYNSDFFGIIFKAPDVEAGLADYFFSKDFYDDALYLFLKHLPEKSADSQFYEKIGYCYQQKEDYTKALVYYQRAELIDRKLWTLKKIGFCFRRIGNIEQSLEYFLQAGDMEPGNIHTIIMIAHCYLDLREYEQALKYYFKVEYSDPGNNKVLRPIAYCYLALGRFDESEKYFDRISENKLSAHDLINKGHLQLCRGRKREAVELYRLGIKTGEISKEQFLSVFSQDTPLLLSLGVNPEDLPIITDYLLFTLD
jgi:tetratricopeptide (TPR) repeat protein